MKPAVMVRVASRIGIAVLGAVVISLFGVQSARVIGRNVALAQELHAVQNDIVMLQAKRAQQLREIRRLSDPRGAIPEIHDRLHLVGDKEAIIYLKRGGSAP